MYDFREWKHAFKLDPNKKLDDDALEALCESGTDAVIVGGSDGVSLDNTIHMLSRIRRYSVPCALEVSNLECITPGFDYYFIPTVLNSKNAKWISGLHHAALKEYGDIMNWDEIIVEGYCILNKQSKAADITEADVNLDMDDMIAYARMAEKLFHLPIFYIEYSGTYGDPKVVENVKQVLDHTKLFYGGGITDVDMAKEMSTAADTIIVGNIIYEDLSAALKTVLAVQKD